MSKKFEQQLAELGITLTQTQFNQFDKYYEMLVEWNKVMNLTGITEYEEVNEKHFVDSLALVKALDISKVQTVIDIGTGAGFPGIPLKIVFPDMELTIVEPLQKRCRFLETVKEALDLKGVNIYPERAEDFVKEHRESYDVVSARAVARLSILLELCAPLVKMKGHFIALKGKQGHEELLEAQKALDILGMKLEKEDTIDVDEATRINLYMQKVKPTPNKYPRAYGQIKKKPLGGV